MSLINDFTRDPRPTARTAFRMLKARWVVRRSFDLPIGPVVAYGHPKTATTSANASLSKVAGLRSFHAHVLRPKHFIWRRNSIVPPMPSGVCSEDNPPQWALADGLDGDRTIHLITLVRDPVAVQASWFFFGMQRWLQSPRKIDIESLGEDELRSIFQNSFPQDGILNWFDEEWSIVTGHRLEDLTSVASMGHATVEFGPHRACVLASSLDDETKSRILEKFLDLKTGTIDFPRKNISSEQPHGGVYRKIKSLVASDAELIDRCYESRYAKLLFSPDSLAGFRRNWRKRTEESTRR